MSASNIIASARGLSKSFGKSEVLHSIDFDIPAGRIYGLVGKNGAGLPCERISATSYRRISNLKAKKSAGLAGDLLPFDFPN